MDNVKRMRKLLLLSVKIAVGSSAAIYIAQWLQLDYATSAGTIALLTLMTTKWESVRLSLYRIVTYIITLAVAWLMFLYVEQLWLAYGIFIFIIVFVSDILGWKATISVNSVIGTHLLVGRDFSMHAVYNEFILIVIGITMALILNLFNDNRNHKKVIVANMRFTESQLQIIMGELAAYLSNREMQRNVWEDICSLEIQLESFIKEAYEYEENTFQTHTGYYAAYFEMRQNQCNILHNLHYEMKKIRAMPKQAGVIADYMLYLTEYVVELNAPSPQIEKLNTIFADMKQEALPVTRDEFESRALLYHILMDIEEFLVFKQRFVNGLNEKQKKAYWNQ